MANTVKLNSLSFWKVHLHPLLNKLLRTIPQRRIYRNAFSTANFSSSLIFFRVLQKTLDQKYKSNITPSKTKLKTQKVTLQAFALNLSLDCFERFNLILLQDFAKSSSYVIWPNIIWNLYFPTKEVRLVLRNSKFTKLKWHFFTKRLFCILVMAKVLTEMCLFMHMTKWMSHIRKTNENIYFCWNCILSVIPFLFQNFCRIIIYCNLAECIFIFPLLFEKGQVYLKERYM